MVILLFSSNCTDYIPNNGSSAPLTPSVPDNVKLGLTVVYIVLYSLLFAVVYAQLWLILYYGYKRISFQTVFLFLCAAWSGLRTTLFSFYIEDTRKANTLPLGWDWLLYCFPVCLQFFTLCLLNLYFSQVMFKAKPRYAANPRRYKNPLRVLCFTMSIIFLGMNIACAVVVFQQTSTNATQPDIGLVKKLVIARVLVNDTLFIIGALWLAYCIIRISKTTSANILLEAKGTSVCQASTVGVMVFLLYTSRAVYNLLAVSPLRCKNEMSSYGFDWYNVSDQADLVQVSKMTYVQFGLVLFVWELLPTSMVIFFFRVRKPVQNMAIDDTMNYPGHNAKVYFFDNPHQYDSDDDASKPIANSTVKDVSFTPHASSILRTGGQRNVWSQSSYAPAASLGPRHGAGPYYHDPYRSQRQKSPSFCS